MAVILKRKLIFMAFFTSLITLSSMMDVNGKEHIRKFNDDGIAALSDDEISYALSELSFDDLNNLCKLVDMLSDEVAEAGDENDVYAELPSELRRFKRQSPEYKRDQSEILPKVDQKYIEQLEESFPNIIQQPNQDDKEKNLIRVKRD